MKSVLIYIFLIALSMIILIGCAANNIEHVTNSMEGIFLKSNNGQNLIINDLEVVIMGNDTGEEKVFDDLKSGDKIEITSDAVNESFPSSANVTHCDLIERGSVEDIPQETLDLLKEMGWTFDLSD
ncbi:hypothetical protein [Alkalicoccobacillus murimartini]|uniref:DUF3221 domain-containing protein n=1 Tax=Alkalicoccobacillus murimartini TaxID=171685 RepID=A0ABT9YL64_9BACI|nr:hypothetical protein [Alkalicoccobacillus murimartini]MDQ0208615.1 hypothetical protein [Alkalicoccobacillus murimartini]